MEWARRHQLPPLPPKLDPALSDDRREVVRELDPLDPSLRHLHPESLAGGPLAATPCQALELDAKYI